MDYSSQSVAAFCQMQGGGTAAGRTEAGAAPQTRAAAVDCAPSRGAARVVYAMTLAGKAVWCSDGREGDEELSSKCGVATAVFATVARSGETVRSIRTTNSRIVLLSVPTTISIWNSVLILRVVETVCVCDTDDR